MDPFYECEALSLPAILNAAYVVLNSLNYTFLHLRNKERLFTFKSEFASTKNMQTAFSTAK